MIYRAVNRAAIAPLPDWLATALAPPEPEPIITPLPQVPARCETFAPRPTLGGVPSPDRHDRDGRTLINRAEVCRTFEVSETTAERWWRNRARNGHPPVAHREGRRLWWDEEQMRSFADSHESEPDELTVDGGRLLSRAALARRYAVRDQSLADLYHRRELSGHPEPVHRAGRRLYWDLTATDAWWAERQGAQRSSLTHVDRTGDPDELVTLAAAARVLGYHGPQTITSFRSRNTGFFPDPDAANPNRWRRRTPLGIRRPPLTARQGRPPSISRGAGRRATCPM